MTARTPASNHPWRRSIREDVYTANLRKRRDSIEASISHLKAELKDIKKKLTEIDKCKNA